MKKIAQALCILLCLAMVLSFAAMAFAAEDTYATIDFADQSFRTSLDKSAKEQVWESNGLKITIGNEKEYDDHVRFNKSNKVTIEYPGMKNIVFVCPHDAYAKYFESIVDGMEGVSVSVENYTATITFDEPCDSWTIEKITSATRVEKMTVYTGDVFDVEDEVIEPDVVDVPEAGKAYKFAYENEIKVYANGKAVAATSSLGADKDLKDAADVYLETVEGGYYFYFLLDGAKKYINVVNMKPTLQDTGATVYTYDEELMTLVTDIEGVSYVYGLEGGVSGNTYALKLLLSTSEKIVAYANFYAQSEGESDEPVVSAVELQEGVNNFSEDTTFAFTAPANGTLTLNVNTASMFTTPGTIADAAYSVNGGEFINLTRGVSEDIELNAGDEVIVEGYATAAAKLTVTWVEAEPVAPAVQLQEGVNNFNEDTTFTFTAPANGTLTLTVNTASMFTTPGTIADAAYSINGSELIALTRGVAMEIALNAGDEVIVEGYATAAAKLTVVWTATPAACQHTNTKVEGAVEATCTAAGFTGNTVCADCGEQIAAGTEIAALGHAFVDGTCAACGAADPDYVKPVVNLTIGQNPINNEEITYTYTAAADGTLNLSLSISAMAIRDHLNLSYSINGGEAVVLASGRVANVNKDIALNKNDVIEITIETNLQTALVATWTEKVVENKTITIGDKTFTTVDGKWAFNQEMTAASSTGYNMIIMTKAFTGSFVTNGYGVAIVLDQYGTLVRVYDGANVGYWTVDGKAASAHFGANDYAITAWNELQEGETLVVFTHTGSEGNVARQFGLNVRSLCGQTATLTGFEFAAAPCKHTNTKVEGAVEATCEEKGYTGNTVCADCGETVAEGTEIAALGHNYVDGVCANCNNPKTFDVFGIMVAVMAASGTALVCLKKKED